MTDHTTSELCYTLIYVDWKCFVPDTILEKEVPEYKMLPVKAVNDKGETVWQSGDSES